MESNILVGGSYIGELLKLLDLSHRLQTVLDTRCLELYGLSLQQLLALSHIEANGEMTVSHLAEQLSRSNHTVTSLLDRLEQRRLVERRRDLQGDRRRVWVRATPLGKEKAAAFRRSPRDLEHVVLGLLDEAAKEGVRQAIATLHRLLG